MSYFFQSPYSASPFTPTPFTHLRRRPPPHLLQLHPLLLLPPPPARQLLAHLPPLPLRALPLWQPHHRPLYHLLCRPLWRHRQPHLRRHPPLWPLPPFRHPPFPLPSPLLWLNA